MLMRLRDVGQAVVVDGVTADTVDVTERVEEIARGGQVDFVAVTVSDVIVGEGHGSKT